MRIILYTGKGGVGKTTISAMTAVRAAELGHRTVVISTDSAHSLADALDRPLGHDLVKIAPRLWAQELDVNRELQVNWDKIHAYLTEFLKRQGFEDVIAEEMALFPGMEELFSLLKLREFAESGDYDLAIIDCAPTGSTMRMLSFPEVAGWYMEKFFHIERKLVKAFKPVAERIMKVPLPTEDVYDNVERLYLRLKGMKDLLSDAGKASIRLVFNPERMVIKESQRALTYLSLYGFSVDCVFANRVLPKDLQDPYMAGWRDIQTEHMKTADACFSPLPILQVPLFPREIGGVELLGDAALEVFGNEDPASIYHTEKPFEVSKKNGEYRMTIHLPFAVKENVELWVKGDDLILRVNNVKRSIQLPRALVGLEVKRAKLEQGRFLIIFEGRKK
ncbi:MAG: ArsA family ATPase [Deltaproteobacteria bacterium]|nr:ArsA family ATPase [Deltaproteobacteria bacterium]